MDAPLFNLHDIVLLITAALSVVFIVLRFAVSGNNREAGSFLVVFFVCIAVNSVCTMLLWNEYITLSSNMQKGLPYLLGFSSLLKGTALWLYIRSLVFPPTQFKPLWFLHLFPCVILSVFILCTDIDTQALLFASPAFTESLSQLVNVYWYGIKVIPVLYGIYAIWEILKYKTRLKQQFADIVTLAPNWLHAISFGFTLVWLWTLIVNGLGNVVNVPLAGDLGIADNYFSFILVVSLFVYSMSHAQSLIITHQNTSPDKNPESPDPVAIAKVEAGVQGQALHLKHNINIEQFSETINLPVRETSAVINRHFGTNFFEFINEHRVNEAKRRLSDSHYDQDTIAEIFAASGFNSASAFQRFFKRFTGLTPSAYRKHYRQSGSVSGVNSASAEPSDSSPVND
ncbi:HTH-type transcriptional activator Btr [Thalassocella blandensis]|nr:HTH-type transcriptional activator Btr [Thalassocella blandensis]